LKNTSACSVCKEKIVSDIMPGERGFHMTEKSLIALYFFPLLVSITACCIKTSPKVPADTAKEICIDENNNGDHIDIRRNQILVVRLEGNPTTGYTWEKTEPESEKVIQQVGREYNPESDRVGAPGVQVFLFKGIKKGRINLRLVYHRPWEKEKKPLKVFAVKIRVR
jgi:inhibitor of cysteine peptidase